MNNLEQSNTTTLPMVESQRTMDPALIELVEFGLLRFPTGRFEFGKLPMIEPLLAQIDDLWYDVISAHAPMHTLDLSMCFRTKINNPKIRNKVQNFLRRVKVESIDLPSNSFQKAEHLDSLIRALSENKHVKNLKLRHVTLHDGQTIWPSVALILRSSNENALKTLDISNNSINESDALRLARLIEQNESLEELNLSECRLGENSNTILKAVGNHTSLRKLSLADNQLQSFALTQISKHLLSRKCRLMRLDLSSNQALFDSIETMDTFCDALGREQLCLEELILADCHVTTPIASQRLIKGLTRNQSIRSLDVAGTFANSSKEWMAFVTSLPLLTHVLDLRMNAANSQSDETSLIAALVQNQSILRISFVSELQERTSKHSGATTTTTTQKTDKDSSFETDIHGCLEKNRALQLLCSTSGSDTFSGVWPQVLHKSGIARPGERGSAFVYQILQQTLPQHDNKSL